MPIESSDDIAQVSHSGTAIKNYYWDTNSNTPIVVTSNSSSIIGITSALSYTFIDSVSILIPFYSSIIYCSTEDKDLEYSIVLKGNNVWWRNL